MHKQILIPLVALFASASLLLAVPSAPAKPVSSTQPVVGPPDPWLQSLYAQARFKNVQAIDPWQSNLYARKAYETRRVTAASHVPACPRTGSTRPAMCGTAGAAWPWASADGASPVTV